MSPANSTFVTFQDGRLEDLGGLRRKWVPGNLFYTNSETETVSLFSHKVGRDRTTSPGYTVHPAAPDSGSWPSPQDALLAAGETYLLDVIAGEELHQLLLEPPEGRAQGEEQVIQVPRDGLLEPRLPEGVACGERLV